MVCLVIFVSVHIFRIPRVCIATASPAKFEEAVLSAGLTPQPTEGVKALDGKPTRYKDLEKADDWLAALRAKIEEIYLKARAETTKLATAI